MADWTDADFPVIDETPWGVAVLDVQALTQHVLSSSRDPEAARNAGSYTGDDGAELARQPAPQRLVEVAIELPCEDPLVDGVVSRPMAMEDKWAVYLERRELLFVRAWQRRVVARAVVRAEGSRAVIGPVRGAFVAPDESAEMTRRWLTYVLRDIALGEGLPTPLPFAFESARREAALWAFSAFGRRAKFVTHHAAQLQAPTHRLAAHNALHVATARNDRAALKRAAKTIPRDARGPDGLAPLHWAVGSEAETLDALLDAGASVDVRSVQGATPLMQAVQARRLDALRRLLARGAAAGAADARGFTALHRAAEMGLVDHVDALLVAGAPPTPVASTGDTPKALAELRGEAGVLARLSAAGGR